MNTLTLRPLVPSQAPAVSCLELYLTLQAILAITNSCKKIKISFKNAFSGEAAMTDMSLGNNVWEFQLRRLILKAFVN